MSVTLKDGTIVLAGDCGVEEAEALVTLIQRNPQAVVDVSESGHVHTALWQVLMLFAPPLSGVPSNPFVRNWVMPGLAAAAGIDAAAQLAEDGVSAYR